MGFYAIKVRCSSGHNPGDIIDSDRPEFKNWNIPAMLARGHIKFAPPGATPTDAPVQLPAIAVAGESKPKPEARPGKTNLNTAPKTKLKELPGIGDSSADALMSARPLQTFEQVRENLPHIKGDKWTELEPLIEL